MTHEGLQPKGQLIGIGGLLYAGKDAVADYLVERYSWNKRGMSDPLNDALLALNPQVGINARPAQLDGHLVGEFITYQRLYEEVGYVEAKKNPEVRRLLQALGTEVGRNMIDENVWVDVAAREIEKRRTAGQDVIITGMRFPNELDMIRRLGGHLWWVSRPGVEGGQGTLAVHASESSVGPDDFDTTILNVGDLDDLYEAVEIALEKYM